MHSTELNVSDNRAVSVTSLSTISREPPHSEHHKIFLPNGAFWFSGSFMENLNKTTLSWRLSQKSAISLLKSSDATKLTLLLVKKEAILLMSVVLGCGADTKQLHLFPAFIFSTCRAQPHTSAQKLIHFGGGWCL